MKKAIIVSIVLSLLWVYGAQVAVRNILEYREENLVGQGQEVKDYFDMINLDERDDQEYYTMVDEGGRVIMKTARHLHAGDRYITRDNRYYEVFKVEGDKAYAREIKKAGKETSSLVKSITIHLPWSNLLSLFTAGPGEQDNRLIGIYHSHGAESYVPSDGSESIDQGGGVVQVGEAMAQALESLGIDVIHSRETHVPHDAGAYVRSRRTVEEKLKEDPDALFDVHRDAAPAEEYLEEVEGEERVQIMLVVGRQNQNSANNQRFAEGLKAVADQKYPGLVKGILMANGNYNQDLSPRNLILEVGSHENEREGAEESVVLFADVANGYLYGSEAGREQVGLGAETREGPGGIAAGRVITLIVLVILGAGAYLLISTGNLEEFKAKLKNFMEKEFKDLGGILRPGGKGSPGQINRDNLPGQLETSEELSPETPGAPDEKNPGAGEGAGSPEPEQGPGSS